MRIFQNMLFGPVRVIPILGPGFSFSENLTFGLSPLFIKEVVGSRSEGKSSRGIPSPGGEADEDQVFQCCRVVSCRRRRIQKSQIPQKIYILAWTRTTKGLKYHNPL